jgi:uncharacterized protein YybS (DUF2232 family)
MESLLTQSKPLLAGDDRPMGRYVRSVAGYSAATALMIITPLLVFIPAVLYHCGLRNGRRSSWVVLAVGVAAAFAYVGAFPPSGADAARMTWTYIAAIGLAIGVPALFSMPLVERGESFGKLLLLLLLGSVVGLATTELGSRALLSWSPFQAQLVQAQETGAALVKIYQERGMAPEMLRLMERWAGYSTYVLPGVILINISLVFILSLLMLGRLRTWRELAARRGDESLLNVYLFRNLSLPDWLLFGFLIGGLTPLATGLLQKIAANTLAIVSVLYIFQGLAIFRFMLLAMGAGFAGTMLGWLLLVFLTMTGIGPLLLGVAGLFDSFFDFRHFTKRKDDSHESHSD